MPQPRKARRKHAANGTRASRRHIRDSEWVLAKLQERFDRFAELYELKRQQEEAAGDVVRTNQEKAPGLATEGSVDLVIPGEDPGPPETQALAAAPARRATPPAQGRGGTTVLTD